MFKFFSRKKSTPETDAIQPESQDRGLKPNPHLNAKVRSGGFFSTDVSRFLQGWDSSSNTIDYYLRSELREMRARSRKMVRSNPIGKRFITTLKANVVGPSGVTVQAQVVRNRSAKQRELDTPANDAIEAAYADWAENHCDYFGRSTLVDLQNMAIASAGQDGEYIFRKEYGGKYGFQLRCIDPELLDVRKNELLSNGGEIRLGVEYSANGRIVAYWFRERHRDSYDMGKSIRVLARHIIHGFIGEWPDQSRGIPWMHAGLERAKHLEKYEEAAIVKARSTASTMAVIKTPNGDTPYTGDEYDEETGEQIDEYEAGTIKDIGNREVVNLDSDYPHQMYADFVKSQMQSIASALGISYHSLANDLEGVNYSSIRAGVLEDREIFKGLQNWFIRGFVRPVYMEWLGYAYLRGLITIGNRPLSRPINDYERAHFQGRRWAWVDPQKDGAANELAVKNRLKSRSQLMREQGDDPESVWREIERENTLLESLGIQPIEGASTPVQKEDQSDAT